MLATVGVSLVGCKSTNVDEWRSDLKTQLCPAKFKPVYEVMKDKGIVKGDELGNALPNASASRAEVAAILMRLAAVPAAAETPAA